MCEADGRVSMETTCEEHFDPPGGRNTQRIRRFKSRLAGTNSANTAITYKHPDSSWNQELFLPRFILQ
jgi:hypothetical protein